MNKISVHKLINEIKEKITSRTIEGYDNAIITTTNHMEWELAMIFMKNKGYEVSRKPNGDILIVW